MQNSSEFQYVAIDQIVESTTNPRQSFDQDKLEELAKSIGQHGVIQPIVVRPREKGFELVTGARRFRASQLAEKFSIPAHIKELTDAQVLEWQLIENSQRIDVHPYQEAQGFQRLLNMPSYDVAAIAAKSGKSASHIYARLALLQLIPEVAKAFEEDRITASHANLIARLPQEHQVNAFNACWRKDWNDKEPHLLPAKNLGAWIESNLYLDLSEAPFDLTDSNLSPGAGSCLACPKRSGYNSTLFEDVQGDQCLDAGCFQTKLAAHIEFSIVANPQLVQIETAFVSPKEHRQGALRRNEYRELDTPDNPDAEPPCPHTKSALVVHGRGAGKTIAICTDNDCPVHNLQIAARLAREEAEDPTPVMQEAPEDETEEEAAERIVAHERLLAEREAERQQRIADHQAELDREEQEQHAAAERRKKVREERLVTLERVLNQVPATLDTAQLRLLISLLVHIEPYDFLDDVAAKLGGDDEERTNEEVVLAALAETSEEGLAKLAVQILLTDHVGIPREGDTDWLQQAETVFASVKAESVRKPNKAKKVASKAAPAKHAPRKKAA